MISFYAIRNIMECPNIDKGYYSFKDFFSLCFYDIPNSFRHGYPKQCSSLKCF